MSRRACPTASSSSTTRAASPPGGGCSARSELERQRDLLRDPVGRADRDHVLVPVRFPSTDELSVEESAAAPIRSYPRPSALAEPLKGLDALGIETLGDLIEHFPHSHSNRELQLASQLAIGQQATVAVTVRTVSVKPMRNRRQ